MRIRLRDLLEVTPGEQLVEIREYDYNLDTTRLMEPHHVSCGLWSTYSERRVVKVFTEYDELLVVYIR